MRHLPLFFDTEAAHILLVGGAKGAVQRLRHLQATSADITVLAVRPTAELRRMGHAHAKTRFLERDFLPDDLQGDKPVKLVFLAPENAEERQRAKEIAALARQHKIPVNAIDDKALCDFYMPSMVKREPVVVAIGTEGTAPLLARNIKGEIEKLLPQNLGTLAEAAGNMRDRVKKLVPQALRRQFWQSFFDSPIAEQVAHGTLPSEDLSPLAKEIASRLQKPQARLDIMTDIDLAALTPDARTALREADVVLYEYGTPQAILNLVRRDADFIATDSGSFAPVAVIAHLENHRRVVRIVRNDSTAAAEATRYQRLKPASEVTFHLTTYQPTEQAA